MTLYRNLLDALMAATHISATDRKAVVSGVNRVINVYYCSASKMGGFAT